MMLNPQARNPGKWQGSKRFFFEKKKQKTFSHNPVSTARVTQEKPGYLNQLMEKVFLLLFVHKKKILTATCLLFLSFASAQAVEPEERLADPAQEARARAIGAELRCLVCQNESIDDSGAALAHDIRVLLRERIAAGDSDAKAQQAIVDRYGDFVLLRPPVKPVTYVLWFGPVGMLLLGVGGLVVWLRGRAKAPAEVAAALSAEERARLEQMLRETES